MFRLCPARLLVLLLGLSALAQNPPQAQSSNRSQFVGLPLAFEANRGQASMGVDFVARGQGYSAQLRADRVTLSLSTATGTSGDQKTAGSNVIEIAVAGANRNATAAGEEKLPGHSNYLIGSNPANWITDVEQFAEVQYANIYPGIDLVFHGNQNRLEHDFVIHPGANVEQVGLTFSGIPRTELQGDGDLMLQADSGDMCLQKPRAYQVIDGKEHGSTSRVCSARRAR